MTFREFIKTVGYDHFHRIAKGWFNVELVMEQGLDWPIERYLLWANAPFYMLNEAYNVAYDEDNGIGSTYDWLYSHPSDQEIDTWLEYYTKGKED